MAKYFKVQLTDVTFTNNDDASNFLEGTEVTEISFQGDNKLKSLDSFAKDCIELLTITPGIDFANIEDFDKLLYNTPNLKSVILKNVTSKGISLEDAFPFTLEYIAFSGEYTREALQHIIDLQEWTFDEFAYLDTVLANVTDVEVILTNDNKISTYDTLEKKARYLEIHGESLNNRTKDSNKTYDLIDYATVSMVNGVVTPNDNLKVDMLIQNIDGNTYNNLLGTQGRGTKLVTSTPIVYNCDFLLPSLSYCIKFTCNVLNAIFTIDLGGTSMEHRVSKEGQQTLYARTPNSLAHKELRLTSNNAVIGKVMIIQDSNVPNIEFIESSQSIGIQDGDNYVLTIDLFNKDWDNL